MRRPALAPEIIAAAFVAACEDELAALKPGNVHRFADGHRMTVADFEASAQAAAPALVVPGAPVGARILAAVEATRAAVGTNTNLGIVLLCAPLAAAAEAPGPLRERLKVVLATLTVADADAAFRAIRLAAPAGLGAVPGHDVADAATIDLRAAMTVAAPRDRIAHQYVTGFADVISTALPLFRTAVTVLRDRAAATTLLHLGLLSAIPRHPRRPQARRGRGRGAPGGGGGRAAGDRPRSAAARGEAARLRHRPEAARHQSWDDGGLRGGDALRRAARRLIARGRPGSSAAGPRLRRCRTPPRRPRGPRWPRQRT